MEACQSCNALQWSNLTEMKPVRGSRSAIILNAAAIKLCACCKPISNSIHSGRDIALECDLLLNTMPLHPPHYEVLINCTGVSRNGLTSWLIALALSSTPHTKAAGHIHLVASQPPRSLVYTSLGWSLLCIS